MTQIRAVSAFFSNLTLDNLDQRSSIRQGLQRLLLLRSFVAASGLVIFLLFQALSNLQGPVAFILSIVMAIFASV